MPYWQLFYHCVWATKNRLPLLTLEIEPTIHEFVRGKALGLGASVFAINGTVDHVHLVVAILPSIAVAKFIGQIKAVASTKFNKSSHDQMPFFWQEEYGVFSFDHKRLPNYIAYVENQKRHHAAGTIIPILERTSEGGVTLVREANEPYVTENAGWREELEAISVAG